MLGFVVGIIVVLGFIALIIPGIIFAIMFSMSVPVLLLENKGVFESMSRSRQLVSNKWLGTFNLYFVLGVIIAVAATVLSIISGFAGPWSSILSSTLSALWQPLIPIALTVYYYSNVTRTSPIQAGPTAAPSAPATTMATSAPSGMKFCPSCGTQMPSSATFCPKCGARQPA